MDGRSSSKASCFSSVTSPNRTSRESYDWPPTDIADAGTSSQMPRGSHSVHRPAAGGCNLPQEQLPTCQAFAAIVLQVQQHLSQLVRLRALVQLSRTPCHTLIAKSGASMLVACPSCMSSIDPKPAAATQRHASHVSVVTHSWQPERLGLSVK